MIRHYKLMLIKRLQTNQRVNMYIQVWIHGEVAYEVSGDGLEKWIEDNIYNWTGKTIWFT